MILAGAAAFGPTATEFGPEFFTHWHEFFVVAGTAAATLAALLFVAIALHVETLVVDQREHLLGLARAILFSFVMVLILSLMMLVPGMPPRIVTFQLIALGGVSLIVTFRQLRGQKATDHAHFSLGLFRKRLILPIIGYLWVMATGIAMLTVSPMFFYWMTGAVSMLLGNATGASWDLLVRVARIKRADALARGGAQEKADVG